MGLLTKLLLGAAAWEGTAAMLRLAERKRVFEQARARAKELGKPLVVVGDPYSGAHTRLMPVYDCGDLCVDLHGCPQCPHQVQMDLTTGRIPLEDDSAVVFVSCVLEYVDDVKAAWRELRRVGGQNVFVARVGGWSFTTLFFPGAKWTLSPFGSGFVAHRISEADGDGWALL